MITIQFPRPGDLVNLNDRKGWRHRSQLAALWRDAAFYGARHEINAKRLAVPQPPSFVQVTLPVTSLTYRRDPHNFTPTDKAIIDGLVDAKVWPDDNEEWVTHLDPRFDVGGMVQVTLWDRATETPTYRRSGEPI